MKKRLNITIDEEIIKYLEDNFINISAYLNALIKKNIQQVSINVLKKQEQKMEELPKEIEEIFNEGTA